MEWFWNRKPRVYSARGMTGWKMSELRKLALQDKRFFEQFGYEVIDPVLEEKIPDLDVPLSSIDEWELKEKWYQDKKFIRQVDIVCHMTPDSYSVGAVLETGYNRYFCWAPTVWISPKQFAGHLTVAKFELDLIVEDKLMAAVRMRRWFTWWQRFKWRLPIELKGLPWLLWVHISKFF